jgi:WD40 repeat protein
MALPDIEYGPAVSGLDAALQGVAFDGAYQVSARVDRDGSLVISRLFTGEHLQRLPAQVGVDELVEFSPDGRHLVHAAGNGTVQLWEWRSGRSVLTVERGKRRAAAFSPDSRWLAVGQDRGVLCYSVTDGTELCRWETTDRPHELEFHPESRRLAVGYKNAEVVSIYDASTGQLQSDLSLGNSERVTMAWHPAGRLLAIAGSDPRIQVWDVASPRLAAVLEGHAQQVTLLRFHPGGEILLSMSWDNTLRLWHPVPGRLLMRLPAMSWRGFSDDGRWAGVVPTTNGQARFWGVRPSAEHHTFINTSASRESAPREGGLTPDGALLAIGATDGVRLWDARRGEELRFLPLPDSMMAIFRNEGRELLTCSYVRGVQRWPVERDTQSGLRLGKPLRVKLPFAPERIALSEDHRFLAVVGEEAASGQLIDLDTGTAVIPKLPHTSVAYVALSADAQWLATGGWHSERVRLWSAKTGEVIQKWELGTGSRVHFTPDSRELIIARSEEFIFHDTQKLGVTRRLTRASGLYPGHVAFTSDGRLMALELTPGVIDLKAVATGQTLARLENPRGDASTWMAFTSDDQLIVAAQYANTISRWDLPACRARLKAMNLDWDWPEFPARPATPPLPASTRP